ncbi:MAG: DUF5522 domain-containing protein [Candidatus Methylacidiphilales bacterium]|nr:DUF5522 domain-containing protein [Candidatus Methylacidiphilales bacterium]
MSLENERWFDPTIPLDPQLQPEADFYLENGLVVFTAAYLLKRGHCCESGCRHCPYQKKSS